MKEKRRTRVRTTPFKGSLQRAPSAIVELIDKWLEHQWGIHLPDKMRTSGSWQISQEADQNQVFWIPHNATTFLESHSISILYAGLFIGQIKGNNFFCSLPFLQELGTTLRSYFLFLNDKGAQAILQEKAIQLDDIKNLADLEQMFSLAKKEEDHYVVAVDEQERFLGVCKLTYTPTEDGLKPKISILSHLGRYLRPGY